LVVRERAPKQSSDLSRVDQHDEDTNCSA
jgi:hypothetical protein